MTCFHNFTLCKETIFAISLLPCAFQFTGLIDVVSKRPDLYLKITYVSSVSNSRRSLEIFKRRFAVKL